MVKLGMEDNHDLELFAMAIAGVGVLSRKYPRPVGIVVLVLTALLLVVILGKGLSWGQIATAVVIGIPLILAALCLFSRDKSDTM